MSSRGTTRVGIVGAGVMAEAMIAGLLADRAVDSAALVASHPRRERREVLAKAHGIRAVASNREAARGAEIVVLAVKPQMLAGVMRELAPALRGEQVVLSIVAGATLGALTAGLGHAAVVRAMPNTPAQIRRGITVWAAAPACTPGQRDLARTVLRALGEERQVDDEGFVAMATALSGTGPTYLFAVMEALIDAGVHMGFTRELAHDLVVATLVGSAEFAARSELHPAQLRNLVTSPGGTSAAAIYELERGRIRTVLSDAVWAAYRRTLELGERLEHETSSASRDASGRPGGATSVARDAGPADRDAGPADRDAGPADGDAES
jgi:pyrroline-5-carboxylate reductase